LAVGAHGASDSPKMKPEVLTAYAGEYVFSPFLKLRVSVAGAKLLAIDGHAPKSFTTATKTPL
jgi:hypothetical protein